MDSIDDFDLREVKRRYSLQAGYIHTKLIRVRSALMMRIYATHAAEIMLRRTRIELIQGENIFPLAKYDVIQLSRHRDRSSHAAVRAGATSYGVELISQSN